MDEPSSSPHPTEPRSFPEDLARAARWALDAARDLWAVLRPCRFSLITLLVAGTSVIFVPQGRDLLRQLAEWSLPDLPWLRFFFFYVTLLFWSYNSWYFARTMVTLRFADAPEPGRRKAWLRRWVPVLLGTAPLLAVAAGFAVAAWEHQAEPGRPRMVLLSFATAMVGLSLLPLYHYWERSVPSLPPLRRWARRRAEREAAAEVASGSADLNPFDDLPAGLMRQTAGSMLVAGGLLLLFAFFPVTVAPRLGAAAILFVAAATWVPFGSALVYLAFRYRVPILSLLGLALLLFAGFNDNHAVRTTPLEERPECREHPLGRTPDCPAPGLSNHLTGWIGRRLQETPDAAAYPILLVSAEGGGARAAYWTALVLGRAQEREPDFAEHVYGISGVSGGSLGAAAFSAMLAESRRQGLGLDRASDLACEDRRGEPLRGFADCSRAFLSRDYLSSALSAMLYQDLFQRFLPVPVGAFDRARALEHAWERGWRLTFPGANHFEEPFSRLWQPGTGPMPNLFLNGTWVETGQRVITSNLRFDRQSFPDTLDFHDLAYGESGEREAGLPLATAVHNSARFTYLSPAGRVERPDGTLAGHLVDGGYFENSGAATALDIAVELQRAKYTLSLIDPRWSKVRPVVIAITNSPSTRRGRSTEEGRRQMGALVPLQTLLATREARGTQALAALKSYVESQGGEFLPFAVCPTDGEGRALPVPLGWYLSELAREALDEQLEAPCGGASNRASFERLSEILAEARGPAPGRVGLLPGTGRGPSAGNPSPAPVR